MKFIKVYVVITYDYDVVEVFKSEAEAEAFIVKARDNPNMPPLKMYIIFEEV